MLTIAYYFLQVVLCSSIMMGYYWLVLRNKRFHQYNRFYLLGVALLSWCIPLVKINVAKPVEESPAQLINLVNIVAGSNSEIEHIVVQKGFAINWDMVVISLYACVSAIFLFSMIVALLRVYSLLKKHSCKSLGDVYLIMTNNVKGTPFSFFQYIFWNEAVDIQTPTGQQMMQHELAHVREKHSVDKLFMQVVMIFGWFNPFFWLLKKELNLIHEFIADNKAIKNGDASSLAAMLLTAAYPNQQYLLTNPFFFSPIKRRILMLTKTNNPRLSYARRVVVLPLLAVTVMLFAFRKKETTKNIAALSKVYTVVIDAGHGGKDLGASGADGSYEKDLVLLLQKAIKKANTNDKIKLVFNREEDVYQSPIEKAKFVNEQKADLFISLHQNWATKEEGNKTGFEIFIPLDDSKRDNIEQSKLFAVTIEASILKSYKSNGVKTRPKGVWVLKSTTCPAALIECGYISNPKDLALMKDETQRNKMAGLILEGITNYLKNANETSVAENKDGISTSGNVLDELFTEKKDSIRLNGKTIPLTYKGEKLISIKCVDVSTALFLLVSANHQWKVSLQDISNRVDKIDTDSPKSQSENKKIEELKALYIACLQKKEEAELAAITTTRSKINSIKNKQFDASWNIALANNDLVPSRSIEDIILADLVVRRNELISEDKSSNAKVITFLNDKISQRIKDLKDGKLVLKVQPVNNAVAPKLYGNSYKILSADTLVVENAGKRKMDMSKTLILVDGVRMTMEELQKMNPNDISTVKVFKDEASIAPYAEAGKNGVTLITTKRKKATITMLSPLNNSYIAQYFGEMMPIANSEISGSSDGWLIRSKEDNLVKSISDGTVVFAGEVKGVKDRLGGNCLVLVQSESYFYGYAMLANVMTKKGDVVVKGGVMGKAGIQNGENNIQLSIRGKTGSNKAIDPATILASK